MKIHYPDDQKIKEYFESDRINATALKKTLTGVKAFESEPSGDALTLGNLVETMLMYPKDIRQKKIKIVADKDYSGKTKDVVNEYVKQYDDYNSDSLIEVMDKLDYHSNKKRETRLKYTEKHVLEALKEKRLKSIGVIPATKDMFDKATKMVDWVRKTKFWNELSLCDEVYFQLPVYFEIEEYKYKALIDILTVTEDTLDKSYHLVDLKTTGVLIRDFPKQFYNLHYDIQLGLYKYGLEHGMDIITDKTSILMVSSTAPPALLIDIHEELPTKERILNITKDYVLMKYHNFKEEPVEYDDTIQLIRGKLYKNGELW